MRKKVERLATTGFNVIYVMAGITKFALGYLCLCHLPQMAEVKAKYLQ